jgi:hypothetical protein
MTMRTLRALCLTILTTTLAGAAPAREESLADGAARPPRALDARDVRSIAVYPFTSGGNVDTYLTTLFVKNLIRHDVASRVIDPYELTVHVPDGEPFHAEGRLEELLRDARDRGADAIAIGVGKWYSMGFRLEVRLVEVGEGRVLCSVTDDSGFHFTGPPGKRDVAKDTCRRMVRCLQGR